MTIYCNTCKRALAFMPPLDDGMIMHALCPDCLSLGMVKFLENQKEEEDDAKKKNGNGNSSN